MVSRLANRQWGCFVGNVETRWIDSDQDQQRVTDGGMKRESHRVEVLLSPFCFHDHITGISWKAPAGTYVDGASIPRLFWRIINPMIGPYRLASVVHDWACQARPYNSEAVHSMFYQDRKSVV